MSIPYNFLARPDAFGCLLPALPLCLAAREYGYQGKEVAGYIQKDPAVVTRYLKEDLEAEAEKVIEEIKRTNINNQV